MRDHPKPDTWRTLHPATAQDQAAMAAARPLMEAGKGKMRGIASRPIFDGIMGQVAAPQGVSYRQTDVGGIAGWWCEPVDARADAALVHLHGGWFTCGSAEAFRHLVGHIARKAGVRAFVPDYRLAPEHPFPAALEDGRACVEGLFERGFRSVAIMGDSAGGNLALSLLSILSAGSSKPHSRLAGAVALSPITDLTLSGESWESRAVADPLFVREQAKEFIDGYLAGHDPVDAKASPLFANLTGLPPIRIHVGDDEVLLDDSVRYVARAVAAGVDATVDVWEGMAHGFLGGIGRFAAAGASLDLIGAFLTERLADKHGH